MSQDTQESGGWGLFPQKTQSSKVRDLLSRINVPELSAEAQWEVEWDSETLAKLREALNQSQPVEEDAEGLNSAILKKAKLSLSLFAQYIPILYAARTEDFEAVLSEVFTSGLQNSEEALVAFVKVLLDMVDQRTMQYYRSRFLERNVHEIKQESPFRIAVKDWVRETNDKIDHQRAPFPIQEALDARKIEVEKVRKELRFKGELYPDDDLVKVVEKVCSESRHFASSFFGLFEYNVRGGFNDIPAALRSLNNQRKAGTLRAHVDILPSGPELSVYARMLMVAHDKLYRAMVSSQENLSKTLTSNLEDERRKNLEYIETIRDLTRRLESALKDNTILSHLKAELQQAKQDLLELGVMNNKLVAELKKEREARIRAEARVDTLQQEKAELVQTLKNEKKERTRVDQQVVRLQDENAKLREAFETEKAARVEMQKEVEALRVQLATSEDKSILAAAVSQSKTLNCSSTVAAGKRPFFGSAGSSNRSENGKKLSDLFLSEDDLFFGSPACTPGGAKPDDN